MRSHNNNMGIVFLLIILSPSFGCERLLLWERQCSPLLNEHVRGWSGCDAFANSTTPFDLGLNSFGVERLAPMAKGHVSLIAAIQTSPFDGGTREQSAGTIYSR